MMISIYLLMKYCLNIKISENEINSSQPKINHQIKKSPSFVLDGVRNNSRLSEYNALKDKHLQGFFYSKGIRHHLYNFGLVNISVKK